MRRELLIEKYISPTGFDEYLDALWINKYGELHSVNGQPSVIQYNEKGDVFLKIWHKNGINYRKGNKPAVIFYRHGRLLQRIWYKNGEQTKTKMY